jgi:hypothetical protein
VNEPEAMIDPEAAAQAPRGRRRRRAIVAGVTLLAVVAGGIAVAIDDPEAKPLALLAGNGAGGKAESMTAQVGAPAPMAPALGTAADARSSMYPYGGGWGLKFEIEGTLPELPDHAAAWRVNGPNLDRAALERIAGALGVSGTPVQRDGGWFVEGGDWTLSAFGGDAMGKGGPWYVNLYRSRYGQPNDASGDEAPAGPAISRADAERRVRELLDRMGAPRTAWRVEATDTEIGIGWACAAPMPYTPEELTKLEAEKLRQIERENTAANGSTRFVDPAPPVASDSGSASGSAGSTVAPAPGYKPGPDSISSCPPPPAPVKGFNIALYPVLDGRRADWPVWNVTMRSDGRIENLSGSWVTFEKGGDYKLRGVDAALKELQSPAVPYAVDTPGAIEPRAAIDPATAFPGAGSAEGSDAAPPKPSAVSSSAGTAVASSAGSAPSRLPLPDDVSSSPAVDLPAEAPVCPPVAMPMPMPAQDDKATSSSPMGMPCAPPAPQVVKITGVELGLIQTSVFENGQVRLAMVPSYRFVGHFVDGTPWETSVIALHPDAIAPPPDYPVGNDVGSGGGTTGVGKAVPPTPTPAPEPAIARDSSR